MKLKISLSNWTKSAVLGCHERARLYYCIRECRKIAALLEKNMQKRTVVLRSASIRRSMIPNSETVDQRRKRCRGPRPKPNPQPKSSLEKKEHKFSRANTKAKMILVHHHAHTCCIGSDTNRQFLLLAASLLTMNSPAFCVCCLCGVWHCPLPQPHTHRGAVNKQHLRAAVCTQTQPTSL
jgi:hypothetical protein